MTVQRWHGFVRKHGGYEQWTLDELVQIAGQRTKGLVLIYDAPDPIIRNTWIARKRGLPCPEASAITKTLQLLRSALAKGVVLVVVRCSPARGVRA